MIPHLVYYQSATPIKPKRRRASEPEPFAGLTQKPLCTLCEQQTTDSTPVAPPRPDPMPPTNRRPRTVDTSMHFCPHHDCDYRGWLGLGNLRANGHPGGGPQRQFHGTACDGFFPEHHGTIFHGKQTQVDLIVRLLVCLAAGLGIRATARVFEVEANTVLHWLVEIGRTTPRLLCLFPCDLHPEQLQLDELYAVLRELKGGAISEEEAIKRQERSPYWVWTVMDPKSKLLVLVDVGSRTLAMAQRVLHQVTRVLAPGCLPLFVTNGFKEYKTAILSHFGHWIRPERCQEKGPMPKPRWMPLPELFYAQVVKSYRRRRIVGGTHRVVFGTQLAVEGVLAACGWTTSTAFIERFNLDIRQRVAAVGRRVNTLCRGEASLLDQMVLFQTYHNFVLPHASSRQSLGVPEATPRTGSAKRRRPSMPTMAAGLTDHVWSLKAVLLYWVPPWPQPQIV